MYARIYEIRRRSRRGISIMVKIHGKILSSLLDYWEWGKRKEEWAIDLSSVRGRKCGFDNTNTNNNDKMISC